MSNDRMMPRLARMAGFVLVGVAMSASACKDDETVELGRNTGASGDADAGAAGAAGTAGADHRAGQPRSGVREGAGGTDVGNLGASSGDIDNLIGGDAGAPAPTPAPRDLGATETEANWRPEGLRVAYSGPKLPCDGSIILKSAPVDDTTAVVNVVDVNEGRVPVDCQGPTTLSILITDVPRTVSTVRFNTPDGVAHTVTVIGATAKAEAAPAKGGKAKTKKH